MCLATLADEMAPMNVVFWPGRWDNTRDYLKHVKGRAEFPRHTVDLPAGSVCPCLQRAHCGGLHVGSASNAARIEALAEIQFSITSGRP